MRDHTATFVHIDGTPKVGVRFHDRDESTTREAYVAITIGPVDIFLEPHAALVVVQQLAALHQAAVSEAVETSLSKSLT